MFRRLFGLILEINISRSFSIVCKTNPLIQFGEKKQIKM